MNKHRKYTNEDIENKKYIFNHYKFKGTNESFKNLIKILH